MPGQMIDSIGQTQEKNNEQQIYQPTRRDPIAKYYKAKRQCTISIMNRTVAITQHSD